MADEDERSILVFFVRQDMVHCLRMLVFIVLAIGMACLIALAVAKPA